MKKQVQDKLVVPQLEFEIFFLEKKLKKFDKSWKVEITQRNILIVSPKLNHLHKFFVDT